MMIEYLNIRKLNNILIKYMINLDLAKFVI